MRLEVRKNRPVRCGTLHTTFHTEDPGTWKSSVSLCKLQGCAVTWLWRESFIKWSRQLQDLVVFGWYPSPSALDLEEASLRSVQRHTGRRHLHVFSKRRERFSVTFLCKTIKQSRRVHYSSYWGKIYIENRSIYGIYDLLRCSLYEKNIKPLSTTRSS